MPIPGIPCATRYLALDGRPQALESPFPGPLMRHGVASRKGVSGVAGVASDRAPQIGQGQYPERGLLPTEFPMYPGQPAALHSGGRLASLDNVPYP